MFLNLINLDKLRRGIIYAFFLFVVLFVQNSIFSKISIFGVRPMFVPIAVIAVGMFEGGVWGGVFGLFAGIFCGMSYPGSLLIFTGLFPVLGFLSGMFSAFLVNKRFFSYFFICLAALVITAICQMFRLLVYIGANPIDLFIVAGLQVLWSLPFTVPLYFPCKALAAKDLG